MGAVNSRHDFTIRPRTGIGNAERMVAGHETTFHQEFPTKVDPLQILEDQPHPTSSTCVINFDSPFPSNSNIAAATTTAAKHEIQPCFVHQKFLNSHLKVVNTLPLSPAAILKRLEPKRSKFQRCMAHFPSGEDCFDCLCWISKVLYIMCPPFPRWMIQKAAFHPPENGRYYFLIAGEEGNRKEIFSAKDALNQPNLRICFRAYLTRSFMELSVAEGFIRTKAHIIKTSMDHYLVAAHFTCMASHVGEHKSPKIMILSQPNSSDLGACMICDPTLVEIADSLNCDLIAYDYSGYGCSTGTPSQEAIFSCIEAIYSFVKNDLHYDDKDITLFGFSMGTAASIHLASIHQNLCGMILIAPFTSLLRIIGTTDNPTTCCLDQFSSYDKAIKITTRTLICHGMNDSMVGKEHSEILRKRLQNAVEPFYVPNATHRGIFSEISMWKRIRKFVDDELGFFKEWEGIVTFVKTSSVSSPDDAK